MTTRDLSPSPAALALAGALCLATAMGIGRFAFTPMLPLMMEEGLLDVARGGWLAAANYVGYFIGALTAARIPMRTGSLAGVALLGTAAFTAAMASPLSAIWLPLRFLAGVMSAWVFVATSVWCLSALAQRGALRAGGYVYAGVGLGVAITGLYCLVAAALFVRSAPLWLQLGGVAFLLALPAYWVIVRTAPSAAAVLPRDADKSPHVESRDMRGLVACYGVMGFGYILPATFLPVLARNVVDDPRIFGAAWPTFGATAAISTLLAIRLMHGRARLKTWAACQLLMGVGVLLPSLSSTLWSIGASAFLVGGTFMVITLAGVQEMRARASADAAHHVGRITAAFAVGQIMGPAVSAILVRVGPNGLVVALAVGAFALFATGAWLARLAFQQPLPKVIPDG
jgi:MFS family permease